MENHTISIVIILVSILMSAYFSATETDVLVAEQNPHEEYGGKGK